MTTTDLLDAECIADLRDVLDAEKLNALVSRFIRETDTSLENLNENTCSGSEIAEVLHKIAGSAAALGADRFRSALVTTETAFREGKLKDARLHLDGLSAIWRETRVLLADLATLEQG